MISHHDGLCYNTLISLSAGVIDSILYIFVLSNIIKSSTEQFCYFPFSCEDIHDVMNTILFVEFAVSVLLSLQPQ